MISWKSKASFYKSIGMPSWFISQKREEFYQMKTGLDDGYPLPKHVIDGWRNPLIIQDWRSGMTLRDTAKKHGVSHEKVRDLTNGLNRSPEAANETPTF
jgi:hypothetical protein